MKLLKSGDLFYFEKSNQICIVIKSFYENHNIKFQTLVYLDPIEGVKERAILKNKNQIFVGTKKIYVIK